MEQLSSPGVTDGGTLGLEQSLPQHGSPERLSEASSPLALWSRSRLPTVELK